MKRTSSITIRKIPLLAGTFVGVVAYEMGEAREFPKLHTPFDMNEHAAHLGPGMAIGAVSAYISSRLGYTRQKSTFIGTGVTAAIGSLFETGIFDSVYRNTTLSPTDAGWTALAGLYGALCIRGSIGRAQVDIIQTENHT